MAERTSPERDSFQAAIAAAEELRKSGRYDEGIRILTEVLRQDPREATAHFRLGNIYIDQGDLALAEEAYLRAIELRPSYTSALNNLAVVYKRQKRIRAFVKTYRRANRAAMRAPTATSLGPKAARARRRALGLILVFVVAAVAAFLAWQQLSRREGVERQPEASAPSSASSAPAAGWM